MLKITYGDLFEYAAENSIIAHGCNAQGVMGSGFAKQLRQRFPIAYLNYRIAFIEGGLELGGYVLVSTKKRHVFNCITQRDYGRDKETVYVDYSAVHKSLSHVAQHSKKYNYPVHIPLIGGGLANGHKDTLIGIFEEVFEDVNCVLYLSEN